MSTNITTDYPTSPDSHRPTYRPTVETANEAAVWISIAAALNPAYSSTK
jgi:hypothetical protein